MLMTNEMHSSYNQFLFHSFLSALHTSNESSRSSTEAQYKALYYAVRYQSCRRVACTIDTELRNTVYYTVLLMND